MNMQAWAKRRLAGRPGLVLVDRQVMSKKGTMFKRPYWVLPDEVRPTDKVKNIKMPTGTPVPPSLSSWKEPAAKPESFKSPKPKVAASKSNPRQWVTDPKVLGLPKDTRDLHYKNGKPTPERAALHLSIARGFLDNVPPVAANSQPIAVLMMGGPASGKSSLTKGLGDDFVRVDPDAIKDRLPEYRKGIEGSYKSSAWMAHEESSDIAANIRAEAIRNHQNMLYDGTGKTVQNYTDMIASLKAEGYHVVVLMPHITVDLAKERNKGRADETGRFVPDDVVEGAYKVIPTNFWKIADMADEAVLFDGHDGANPVWRKGVGGPSNEEEVLDPEFMRDNFPADTRPASRERVVREAVNRAKSSF